MVGPLVFGYFFVAIVGIYREFLGIFFGRVGVFKG